MDFEEWLEEYREHKTRSDADWYPNNVQIFEAGQQSKQAEIDKMKSKLSDIYDASDENKTVAHLLDEIKELLK